ncbi:MAG TPA: hypothetical protein VLD16_10370 [Gaiellaceae bacterium]|nr:hypothetical protein [Gaiellaceae bacterium]
MSRLAIIGALVAALAVPAGAAGQVIRPHRAHVQVACVQRVTILPGRNYGICGGRLWVRDPETGQAATIPFGILQHMNERPDDHP